MKGLTNVGNTCYLNSALQCLLYCPPLTNFILSGLAEESMNKKRINACALATEYISLTKTYWTQPGPSVLDTSALWAAFTKLSKQFANSLPHDAHEAMALLLKHLHDALGKSPRVHAAPAWQHVDRDAWEAHCARDGYSMLTDIFQGQMECTVTGPAGFVSVTYEHFTGLTLDIGASASVQQALNRHLQPQDIDGFGLPSGEVCTVTQGKAIRYAPLVLVVHLKRFGRDGAKVDRFVDYSTTLDVAYAREKATYTLFAACFHRGGHYVSACEVHSRWFLLDDAECAPLEVNSVVNKDAYMLVYKKAV